MLTELQKSRISFHLDYFNPDFMLQITRDTLILTLSSVQELQLVGIAPDPLPTVPSDPYVFIGGVYLCRSDSLLGQVEKAYNKLNSDVIEESLYVVTAGKVTLRSNELTNRTNLYNKQVAFLAQLVGGSDPNSAGRVGHS